MFVELIFRLIFTLMIIGIIGGDICMWFGVGHGIPIGAAIALQFVSILFLLLLVTVAVEEF